MKIVYVASCVSRRAYEALYGASSVKPGFQAQKYHRLFIEGLSAHTRVDVVGFPDAEIATGCRGVLKLPGETLGNAVYHYVWGFRGWYRRIHMFFASFFHCVRLLDADSAVMIDCLNQMPGLGAFLAAKLRRKRCVGIVTDFPWLLSRGPMMALAGFLIRHCTDYVLLTPAMNAVVNPKGKPYVVLEGHADAAMEACVPVPAKKTSPRVCLYAGSIRRIYGIETLVEGFRLAALPNVQLHIYGDGDYRQELERIAEQEPSIVYGGMLLPGQVVEKEMEATLLINPRPSGDEYVKYSFPSKTMEYMSTGTPVLMTKLPALPEEYKPHLYFIREETPAGVAAALKETLSLSDEALFQKGLEARAFVLSQRNNKMQAARVLDMLERNRKK